jgi:membrane-bound lytic murein transglycosylase B
MLIILLLHLNIAVARPPIAGTPTGHAASSLRVVGVSEETIKILEGSFEPDLRDKIVSLSVLGFLGKADYDGHYSKTALKKCRAFLKQHSSDLRKAEKRYGVAKEVLTALLWVETKFGTDKGRFNVPNVFFSLLQAPHPDVMRETIKTLANREPKDFENYKQSAIDRSYAKANWALREITSLDEMRKNRGVDIKHLRGSYAGAFGIPQFIPSSYLQWARPKTSSKNPDLFQMRDAIQSVAFYLKANGWTKGSLESHRAALYHYNRADGYVNVILKLADALHDAQAKKR